MSLLGSRAGAPVVALGLAVVAGLVAACGSAATPSTTATSSAPGVSPPSSTAASLPPPAGPPGGPVPAGFVPAAVTFVSLQTGWVLGTAPCSSPPCTSLVRTNDGGRSWVGIPAPRAELAGARPGGVHRVRFADPENGWVFGPELWATHDGGAHWSRTALPGPAPDAPVSDLEAADGVVHAAVLSGGGLHLDSSPVASDSWKESPTTVRLGAGPVPQAQIVLQGTSGWVVEVDRTVVDGARLSGGAWVPWQPPCLNAGGPAHLAASTSADLVAVCDEGVWSDAPRAVRAYVSSDGGTTFQALAAPLPLSCCVAASGSGRAGTAVAAGNADGGTAVLLGTFDQGASWATVYRGTSVQSWADVGFSSAAQGVAVVRSSDERTGTLLMTLDSGHTWAPVTFRP